MLNLWCRNFVMDLSCLLYWRHVTRLLKSCLLYWRNVTHLLKLRICVLINTLIESEISIEMFNLHVAVLSMSCKIPKEALLVINHPCCDLMLNPSLHKLGNFSLILLTHLFGWWFRGLVQMLGLKRMTSTNALCVGLATRGSSRDVRNVWVLHLIYTRLVWGVRQWRSIWRKSLRRALRRSQLGAARRDVDGLLNISHILIRLVKINVRLCVGINAIDPLAQNTRNATNLLHSTLVKFL